MRSCRRFTTLLSICLIGGGGFLTADELRATVSQPFEGVTHYHILKTEPRTLNIHILEIDPAAPGIRFTTTPSNGDQPGDVVHQRTRDFVAEHGMQIGINANFSAYVSGPNMNLLNIAASNGDVYSPFYAGWPGINITEDNRIDLVTPVPENVSHEPPHFYSGFDPVQDVPLYNTIGGNELILHNGEVIATWADGLHPRTAAGVTADGKLLLFTVDGRNTGQSQGMSTTEVAHVLKEYGALHAINLDGGGSTTLVFADPDPRLVNVPVGIANEPGTERYVGNNLGIFARQTSIAKAPRAVIVSPQSGEPVRLRVRGAPSAEHTVEVSDDLSDWSEVGTVELDGDGEGDFTDETGQYPRRFYRVR